MADAKPNYLLFCGVDISAETFTAAWVEDLQLIQTHLTPTELKPSKAVDFNQNTKGFERFEEWLLAKKGSGKTSVKVEASQVLIVLEATGNYWIKLAARMVQSGFKLAVINPKQAHNFAGSLLLRPKNDKLDAQMLARFAYTNQPTPWQPPDQLYYELYQRLVHRDSLMDLIIQVTNQASALELYPSIIQSVQMQKAELLTTLKEQLKTIDKELSDLVKKGQDEWTKTIRTIKTVPGIGLLTACWLVAASLNFTACKSGNGLVHYAGLAPVEHSSGKGPAYFAIGEGGNGRLRKAMYMASLSAMQYNPAVKEMVERMRAQHRGGKEICCAVGRKLMLIAYGVAKSQKPFDATYHVRVQEQKEQYAKKELKAS
jgi:transposase